MSHSFHYDPVNEYWEHCPPGELLREQCREYAREHGRMNPELAWINTPMDSWEANPFYTGPARLHPELAAEGGES